MGRRLPGHPLGAKVVRACEGLVEDLAAGNLQNAALERRRDTAWSSPYYDSVGGRRACTSALSRHAVIAEQ